MAYTPKTWQCGETIMADDLNHMEQGIAQGGSEPLIIHFTGESREEGDYTYYPTDATYNDVANAITSGKAVFLYGDLEHSTVEVYTALYRAGSAGGQCVAMFSEETSTSNLHASLPTDPLEAKTMR